MQTISSLTKAWYNAHIQETTVKNLLAVSKTERILVDDKQRYSAEELDDLIESKNKIVEQERLVEQAEQKKQNLQDEIVETLISLGVKANTPVNGQAHDKLGNIIRVFITFDNDKLFKYSF